MKNHVIQLKEKMINISLWCLQSVLLLLPIFQVLQKSPSQSSCCLPIPGWGKMASWRQSGRASPRLWLWSWGRATEDLKSRSCTGKII